MPHRYQRIVDNVVYNTFRLSKGGDAEGYDVFTDRISADPEDISLLQRRSYIDDFLIPAQVVGRVVCRGGEVSGRVCLLEPVDQRKKSFWRQLVVEYLGHKVDRLGIQTNLKKPEAPRDLTFPTTLRAMQSFLGSVNYYSQFVNDFATIAAVLYEWRPEKRIGPEPRCQEKRSKAEAAFEMMKSRILTASRLRHFDPSLPALVAVYATP
jgi:hypothetical protein